MNKQSLEEKKLEDVAEEEGRINIKKHKRKRRKMKIDGAGVFALQKNIIEARPKKEAEKASLK